MILVAALGAALLAPQEPGWVDELLVVGRVGGGGRSTIVTDEVAFRIAEGTMPIPTEGGTFELSGGRSVEWRKITPGENHTFQGRELSGGYAYAAVESATDRVAVLEAVGHSMVYVNGEARSGDVYSFGFVKIPVKLKKGRNDLFFKGGRGQLRARLVEPQTPVLVIPDHPTLPDWVEGDANPGPGAFAILNCTDQVQRGALRVAIGSSVVTQNVVLAPLTTTQIGIDMQGSRPASGESAEVQVNFVSANNRASSNTQTYTINLKNRDQMHKRTFWSKIDGSVQYYAVQPAIQEGPDEKGLILSVHGAGVEATNQANAYGRKNWAHLVAATNRSPFGFDWEDWGMKDGLEVMADARARYGTPVEKTWLTGHSMGGHGTWMLGALHGEHFGAIGPAAGWIAFSTYGGGTGIGSNSGIEQVMNRAAMHTDPREVIHNYGNIGVHILHGDADPTVSVSQAREMRRHLAEFHPDFAYHEEPGGTHWYDNTPEPGADCVDYLPMMEFFRHRPVKQRDSINFSTANLASSSSFQWIKVLQQEKYGAVSRIQLSAADEGKTLEGGAENIRLLQIDRQNVTKVVLDKQEISVQGSPIYLLNQSGQWSQIARPTVGEKRPGFCGQFKEAFDNEFVLVYGTRGTAAENAASFARARFDAESWWYRGNGHAKVIADTDLNSISADANVVVYGHKNCNAAWDKLLADSPVQVERGRVRVGSRTVSGDDLFTLSVRPLNAEKGTQVGIVAGTGNLGLLSTTALPYFLAGVHYPDLFVARAGMIRSGISGVECAGWFGNDWSVDGGEIAWKE